MAPEKNNCCRRCLGTLISLGLSALFLWLILRTQPPKCSLQSLSLNNVPSHPHPNDTVSFHLALRNNNKDKGLNYHHLRLSFALFLDNATTRPLAAAALPDFYQGRGRTAHRWGSASVARGGARRQVNGSVFVRVQVEMRVSYKVWLGFYVKRQRLVAGNNVEVDARSGEKVATGEVRLGDVPPRLGSRAAQARSCCAAFVGVFVSGLFFTAFT
ncbi:hypothetical protein Fmac_021401 [Flemingia macrophylla]|uniref:Late embryogenesis abundant protein LEA-2 subgroup domain-containing protein n=1 Tax=Flemingia macrophylla TaxID=520843 RepID=A0ABD1LWT8_9FABA